MSKPDFTPYINLNGQLMAFTAFDKHFVEAAKRIGARYAQAKGRACWYLPADKAPMFDAFRAICTEARDRAADKAAEAREAADKAFAALSQDEKAAWYDRVVNEGGEGYNPYRRG